MTLSKIQLLILLITQVLGFALFVSGGEPQFKLLFPREYKGRLIPTSYADFEEITRQRYNVVIQDLNFWGERNYKYVKGGFGQKTFITLDEGKYEYDWWRVKSGSHFAIPRLAEKLQTMNAAGYKAVDHFIEVPICKDRIPDIPSLGEECIYPHIFIFERQKDSKRHPVQLLAGSIPGWGKTPGEEIAEIVEAQLSDGFYPSMVLTQFDILLDESQNKQDILADRPNVKVIRSQWSRGDIKRKVERLAKQGYRIATSAKGIVVMYKNRETSEVTCAYEWLNTEKKDFEKKVRKFATKGIRFVGAYDGRNDLIFEIVQTGKRKSSEFMIVSIDIDAKEDPANDIVRQNLTLSGEKAMETINKIAKDGFRPRHLYYDYRNHGNRKLLVLMEKLP